MKLYDLLYSTRNLLIEKKPVILNLTNYVTQDFIANTLLALGAAPIMSESDNELGELVSLASGISINIGTLNREFNQRALNLAKLARQYSKCMVLDPVGADATTERTQFAVQLLNYSTIVRGNASEIISLNDSKSKTLGVESLHKSEAGMVSAQAIIQQHNNVVVISGETDLIYDSQTYYKNNFGNKLMAKVTGMGCSLSALIAAFATVEANSALASYLAVIYYTLCSEQAAHKAKGPASFKTDFIDCIYQPDWSFIGEKLAMLTEIN